MTNTLYFTAYYEFKQENCLGTDTCYLIMSCIIIIISNWFPIQVVHAKQKIIEGAIGEPYFAQANYWESVGTYVLLFYKYYCVIYKQRRRFP